MSNKKYNSESESDIESDEDSSGGVSKEFINHVRDWTQLDNEMRELQKKIRELRSERKPHEDYLLKNLDMMGETTIEISDGKLIKNKSVTKAPLNKDIIRDAIKEEIKSDDKVNKILDLMKTLRPNNERKYIKRTYNRKKNLKKIITKHKKK